MATFSMNVEAQKTSNGKKVLVAYFSRSGNTKAIASHIKELTGGDLFEIQTAKPYPADYHACTEVAKKEKKHIITIIEPIPTAGPTSALERNGTANKNSMKIVFFILSYSLWLLILYLLTLLPPQDPTS